MENAVMGRVAVKARIDNLEDLWKARNGQLSPDQVRFVEVDDALVDTGATGFAMPERLIAQLGLKTSTTRLVRTSGGPLTMQVYDAVRLTVEGRDGTFDVLELPDDCPVAIGQVPLGVLDFVVDPQGRRLIGNPAHGGEHMLDQY
jgi:predicted aspartyl protease